MGGSGNCGWKTGIQKPDEELKAFGAIVFGNASFNNVVQIQDTLFLFIYLFIFLMGTGM